MDVALATCADLPDLYVDDQPLLAELQRRGLDAQALVWTDPQAAFSQATLTVVRSTWDYTQRRDEFVAWAAGVGAQAQLENSAEVLRWNGHKGYLIELEERGAPIVPTAWLGAGDRVDLAELLADRGWGPVVIKPCVSAGARGLGRFAANEVAAAQTHLDGLVGSGHDVMVQPFVASIESEGETSLVYFDGEFSHAVRKQAASGDFRIQSEFGGAYQQVTPDQATIDLGAWLLEATGQAFLYARVDLVRGDDGGWLLGELEVTEPELYFTRVPDAVARMADAIARRL